MKGCIKSVDKTAVFAYSINIFARKSWRPVTLGTGIFKEDKERPWTERVHVISASERECHRLKAFPAECDMEVRPRAGSAKVKVAESVSRVKGVRCRRLCAGIRVEPRIISSLIVILGTFYFAGSTLKKYKVSQGACVCMHIWQLL